MPQTMLAMLALMLIMLVTVNQYQTTVHLRKNAIRNEVTMQATGVAVDRLETIASMEFDEATRGDRTINSATLLTTGPPFQQEGAPNDLDDFDAVADTMTRSVEGRQLHFIVQSRVRYANPSSPDVEVASKTKFKKVTVRVYSLDIPAPDTVHFSQSFSCGTRCDWF